MPDTKITALAAITTVAPANDLFAIVDVSDNSMAASGTTKNITTNQILGSGGTATLASATITGDLTVRTNKLAVTSSGVGFGTTTPAYPAHFRTTSPVIAIQDDTSAATGVGGVMNFLGFTSGTSGANIFAQIKGVKTAGSAGGEYQVFTSDSAGNSIQRYLIDSTGISTWSVAGTTAMTLNSTGLGIGTASPFHKLVVNGTDTTNVLFNGITKGIRFAATASTSKIEGVDNTGAASYQPLSIGGSTLDFSLSGSPAMTLNANGLGIGVTPSAWNSSYKAIEILGGNINTSSTSTIRIYQNAVVTASGLVYKTGGLAATGYVQSNGSHFFQTAIVGTNANDPLSLTTPMTLDASGRLLVGTTVLNASWDTRLTLSSDIGTTRWAVGPYVAPQNFVISAGAGTGVYLNGTAATSWSSASDERLKDIIEPISNAVSKVASLRAVIGKFKFDENNTRKPFLIAQDVQAVLPEAVDASNPDRLGVAYTDVIPLLVAAIKELTARVQTLEAR
jgi:hypothetical protein